MKYLKILVGLGLIPLGAFAGSHVIIADGTGAALGGLPGGILYCLLFWSAPGLEPQQIRHNVDKKRSIRRHIPVEIMLQ
ncbi:hypothetical protein KSF_009810 [Reticulibacter mediterranei]|uniref:Uncharacterized protein n=1 Tax=Reticulibacter mediterranei TaxID=2778369 RepID=A0A8J3ICA5_9CHLR|nr:hypothetical protein [Reticulibacter mediterranei]GHO90933.1 hypothetical protein KSF_009810 [Reticulibacter mediterranei]